MPTKPVLTWPLKSFIVLSTILANTRSSKPSGTSPKRSDNKLAVTVLLLYWAVSSWKKRLLYASLTWAAWIREVGGLFGFPLHQRELLEQA